MNQEIKNLREDPLKMDQFIHQYEPFVLKTASEVCKRFISKSDDEWSIALIAFSHAIEKFDDQKGNFLSFAELLIRRQLIDYFRSQGKVALETPVDVFEETEKPLDPSESIKLEIESITPVLNAYGFGFMALVSVSPKAEKTKEACAQVILYVLKNELLYHQMALEKRLPIKIIEINTKIPRKIIERHRKYIIAAVEILHGDYPYLSEYLSAIRKEAKDESGGC